MSSTVLIVRGAVTVVIVAAWVVLGVTHTVDGASVGVGIGAALAASGIMTGTDAVVSNNKPTAAPGAPAGP